MTIVLVSFSFPCWAVEGRKYKPHVFLHGDTKVKKIRPDQLIPRFSDTSFRRDPISISSASSDVAQFYKVVKLPLGSVITKVSYYHNGVGPSPQTSVSLERIKMGGVYEQLALLRSDENTAGDAVAVEETAIENSKVEKGYTYYVFVICSGTTSAIHGIKIHYQ